MNVIDSIIKNVSTRKTNKGVERVITLANNMIYVPINQNLATKESIGKQLIVYYDNNKKVETIK